MARIPLLDEEDNPALGVLIARIKAGRRGSLLNIYKALLHSPPLTEAWLGLIDAIRAGTELDSRTREIAIIRVAHVNNSAYEIRQHLPRLAQAAGLTPMECEAIRLWPATGVLNERDAAVVAFADASTLHPSVPQGVLDALKPHLSTREIVELTIVIGAYNMHGRFVEALAIDLEPSAG